MIFEVEVKFKKDFLIVDGNKIIVGVKSPLENGKANKEILQKIAKYFKIPLTLVTLVVGKTSKKKRVQIG